jgi:hypothetical protein
MDAPALQMIKAHADQFGQPYVNSLLSAVPEPGSAAVLMLAFAGMLGGRRQRKA